uniref:phosphopantetheine-binding protein n=1 Tax=Ningiella ruwaisensis TaxID=2364274 RepID=UPI00109FCB48|nr:phosphopantetheine-binding protein [Ningiella ruwaisensis]
MDIESIIRKTLLEVAEMADCTLVDNIDEHTVLLQSGLDSLGFAMLVAQLEEDLAIDPFSEMEMAVYPRTFGEFVAVYRQSLSQRD